MCVVQELRGTEEKSKGQQQSVEHRVALQRQCTLHMHSHCTVHACSACIPRSDLQGKKQRQLEEETYLILNCRSSHLEMEPLRFVAVCTCLVTAYRRS